VCYFEGIGIPKDKTEAVKWLRKAAEGGHANAQNVLGALYVHITSVHLYKSNNVNWLGL
jgi:TPR repeat protein